MIIANNVSALFSQRQLELNEASAAKTMEKLSSGSAINRAADNSSNLSVSEKMRAQIRGLNQASTNVQNGVSFIQTAESYLESTTSVLQRLRELAIQAANGIYSDEDRLYIQVEVSQLVDEVSRVASHAQFNGMNLLTGRFSRNAQAMTLHVGANLDQSLSVYLEDMSDRALGLRDEQSKLDLSDAESANRAISTLDEAMRKVNKQRADLGAYQNRAEAAKRGIDVAAENLTASESRIRDADYAKEMVSFTRDLILQQASTAMLSHANAKNDLVLSLLR